MTKITIDRALVEQALETIEGLTRDRLFTAEWARVHGATIAALRTALAQQEGGGRLPPPLQAEPVTEDMKSAVRWAPSSAYWSERLREFFGPDAREGIDALERRIAGAQERAEPDLSLCPQCNGPADNGHDRSIPPSPYLCTKCMAEMPQPSYNATVVDDAHPNGIPLEQWQNKPVAWRCACGANLYIDADGAPRSNAAPAAPPYERPRLSWDGFNISGDAQSVREVRRLVDFHAARRVAAP
jgi:hypothetical protein